MTGQLNLTPCNSAFIASTDSAAYAIVLYSSVYYCWYILDGSFVGTAPDSGSAENLCQTDLANR
jgi:hypothetical protein